MVEGDIVGEDPKAHLHTYEYDFQDELIGSSRENVNRMLGDVLQLFRL